ncbi:activating signal cointegrator 1 complex subunit 2 isoform X1 [Trichoplusia ni]|uniref:Activating signal cointegrator 1 complex subunit 2 isoform X1 n=2 Tax=Trichoplusia ni TaxID=7111 RepID=A0A7E5WMJ3_TRINI|nr:activating signal cointegrator 1 complex subunit 2 isoform X1 [Trichoplusia ni]
MSSKNVEFCNPENLPVEKLTLSVKNTGVVQEIKALDPFWVEEREFTIYERPPSGSTIVLGAIDTWRNRMQGYLDDVKWLLSLEHYRFWSTILYHPHCMDSLVSFLQEANPPYLPPHECKDVQKLYEDIRRTVLVVFSRLVTNKESKSQWMSKEFMADLIYNKFIFTIPIVWDLCLTYGVDNGRHVGRVLECVFGLQPRYEGDAVAAVAFVKEAFKYIILQVNKNYDSDEPPNLPETFKGFSEIRRPPNTKHPDKITFDILRDLVIHLLDTAMTMRIFIEVYPKGVDIFRKTNFIISIVQLYEYGVPLLYEKLEETGDQTSVVFTEVEGHIDCARAEIIDILREILAVYKNAIFSGEGSIESHVEDYLAVMMDGLSERLFIKDYQACYPVHDDLEIVRQAYPDIDTVKTDFILQAIYSNLDEPIPELSAPPPPTLTNGHSDDIPTTTTANDAEIPDNVREESLISEVKDILPHLGDGFILKCLQHYGFNAERVINSILEDTLADSLRGVDQSLPIIPEDPCDKKFLETGIQRLNVFDGDQFDIMTRDDVDLSKIHVGKRRSKYKDLKDMLDDKTDVKQREDIYSKYNLVCDEVDMYSDEYDDTYDSEGVAPAADTPDERRPFVTPRALRCRQDTEEESEEESGAVEEEKPSSSRSKMDFCVNPEELRARREASYLARRGRGHRPAPVPRNTDVTGKPKGQGQEKEVIHNRDKKEKHKSARANHNRRQGAQYKRSQGMMPS